MLIVEVWLLYSILNSSCINRLESDKKERLNKVHLLLIEMARMVKVMAEKAAKERAREAGDEKLASMK